MAEKDAYAKAGVDYDPIDRVKRLGQHAAANTQVSKRLSMLGGSFVEESRGESAVLFEFSRFYLAHVQEGLGTKNKAAQLYAAQWAVEQGSGRSHYDSVGQCNVAMIVNDLIVSGAEPLSVGIEWAAGDSDWFRNEERIDDLVRGTKHAIDLAGCVWGPGETPVLKDIIKEGALSLSGSGVGIIAPKDRRIFGNIEDGDVMYGFGSSGVHANGLTLARSIADDLPDGYMTRLTDGRTYGDALLAPTLIYARLMGALLDAGVKIHYCVNVTGHGFRKLMRAKTPKHYRYVVEHLPKTPEIFQFMQEKRKIPEYDMFGNFNMGVGMAIMVPPSEKPLVLEVAKNQLTTNRIDVFELGTVHAAERKSVEIPAVGVNFGPETLNI
jgi:phosphoribosylformylglycinamidine cyclo-ligase